MDKFQTICYNIRMIETTSIIELKKYRNTLLEFIKFERSEIRELLLHLETIGMTNLRKHYADESERKINFLGAHVVLIDNFLRDFSPLTVQYPPV